ncbi:23820_t:CDS:2 [Cetraspora pellucida]|uniref:23820_t:CDS:1 n=1 Tax=Cetraspora pellucida TaxID=1433469 RepID=A0A9N8W5P3_9GLOM|nr:23820_t:CDS:2 [Cetraspora pellucida]
MKILAKKEKYLKMDDERDLRIVILPSRITSKIQPIDAGIIAAFKHCYYHFLLQHAIDHNEAGESDIYKTIANCFHHTGLFDYEISVTICEVYPNNKDLFVAADLEELLKLLSICHSINLAQYTNLLEEMNIVFQKFTDADLLELAAQKNDDSTENSISKDTKIS